ncbi:MAG TPA: efflux RND transporter periplasmic adaptor subunit [Polyangiales bacterium]|nr:efflux RND transporter periplasmic adaptor subunit [Polyangiales bacterium]
MKPFVCVALAPLFVCAACPSAVPLGVAAVHEHKADHSVVLRGPSAAYVTVEPAGPATHVHARTLVARVAFDERKVAALGPPVQGRVASVNVVVGDRVEKDAPLLTIHAPDIAAALAQVAETKTARTLAEKNAERAHMLMQRGAGSEAETLTADAALMQAKSEEDRARDALDALGGAHGSSDYALRSPIAGIVVERNVSVGSEVNTGQDQPCVKIADLHNVWVIADVYEQDLARVHAGDQASVDVMAFPGREFLGKITYVGNTVDPQTRVAQARIELANPDFALRPGMYAAVHTQGLAEGAVEIPLSAVLARRDQFFVFTRKDDGTYAQREVRPGEQRGQHIAILSGLKPGDPVVTEGAILLDAEANEAL